MPPEPALRGIPTVLSAPSEGEASVATTLVGGADTPSPKPRGGRGLGDRVADKPAPTGQHGPRLRRAGVYVGEGMPSVPAKLAAKIRRGTYVDMGELLPEFWSPTREDDQPKQEAKARRARSVQDIFTWLQCYGMYVSVLAPQHPSRIPERMAYQATRLPSFGPVRTTRAWLGCGTIRLSGVRRHSPGSLSGRPSTRHCTLCALQGQHGQPPGVSSASLRLTPPKSARSRETPTQGSGIASVPSSGRSYP